MSSNRPPVPRRSSTVTSLSSLIRESMSGSIPSLSADSGVGDHTLYVHVDNPDVARSLPNRLSSYLFHCLRSAGTVEIEHTGFNGAGMAAADDIIDANTEDVSCHVHALQCAVYAGSAPESLDTVAGGQHGEGQTGQTWRVDPPCLDRSHGARVTFEYTFAGMCLTVNGHRDPRSQQQQLADSYSKVSKRPGVTAPSDGEGEEPQPFLGKLRGFVPHHQRLNSTVPSAPSGLPVTLNPDTGEGTGEPEAWESINYPLCYYAAQLEDEDTPQGTTVPVLVGVKCRAIVRPSHDDEDKQPRSLKEVLAEVDEYEPEPPAEQTYVLPVPDPEYAEFLDGRDEDQGSQNSDEGWSSPELSGATLAP